MGPRRSSHGAPGHNWIQFFLLWDFGVCPFPPKPNIFPPKSTEGLPIIHYKRIGILYICHSSKMSSSLSRRSLKRSRSLPEDAILLKQQDLEYVQSLNKDDLFSFNLWFHLKCHALLSDDDVCSEPADQADWVSDDDDSSDEREPPKDCHARHTAECKA